jgi:hypothetical protein
VLVRNPHGDVRLKFTDEAAIGVYATVQMIGRKPREPIFELRHDGDRDVLSIRYAGETETTPMTIPDHTQGRVDLGVWLPRDLEIEVETSDGLIVARRAKRGVHARSVAGRIEVSTKAELDLHSDTGFIIARQESGKWAGTASVSTVSGNIVVAVPVYGDVELIAHTRGDLSSDPGLPVAEKQPDGSKELHARFGQALRRLQVRSESGDIRVLPVIPETLPGK